MLVGRYLSLPILFVAAILQSTVMPELPIRNGRLDLIFTLVLSWGLLAGAEQGIIWALVGGLLQDLVGGVPLGVSALALVIVIFAITSLTRQIERGNLIVPLIVAALGTGAYHLLLMVLYAVLGHPPSLGFDLLNTTLPTMLLNTIFMLPIFRLMGILFEATRPRRVSL